MRPSKLFVPAILGILFLWTGCGGGDGNNNGQTNGNANSNENENENTNLANPARITGTLTVLAQEDRSTFIEEEPNDDIADLEALAEVSSGSRVEIFGEVSVDDNDLADSFHFTSTTPVSVSVILSFTFTEDRSIELAFGITDSRPVSCTLGPDNLAFSECVDSDEYKNPERGTVEVDGDFTITVVPIRGTTNYDLGLVVGDTATSKIKHSARASKSKSAFKTVGWASAPQSVDQFIPLEVLVKFDSSLPEATRRQILAEQGLTVVQKSPSGVWRTIRQADAKLNRVQKAVKTIQTVQQLRIKSGVLTAEPNYRYQIAETPNDEFFDLQWHYDLINLPDAWDITVGNEDVTVAVIDTGILGDHPDITSRLVEGFDFIGDSGTARDGDGIDSDPTDEGDLAGGPNSSSFHGTHVSGTIAAATDNSDGVAGVTWNCNLMPVRALGVGGGSSFDIAESILYAAQIENVSGTLPDRMADVINMSLASPAGSPSSSTIEDAVNQAVSKGVLIVAAAGNEASSLSAFPAAFDNVISVSACDPQLALAPYSNFGDTIDLSAPGGNLSSDLTGDGQGDGVLSIGGTDATGEVSFILSFQHGTSMASPHVAGVAALMKSVNPDLAVADFREILSDTSFDAGDLGFDEEFGAGVIDAAAAVNEAAFRFTQVELTDPKLSVNAESLDFGSSLEQLFLLVSNTGGGVLEVGEISIDELVGSGWLTAEVQASTTEDTNVSAIILRVDRSGLSNGTYLARVSVPATGQTTEVIDVAMTVGQGESINDTIFVVAIDAETRISIAQDETSAQRGFEYSIDNLPAGTYKVYAGTDRDEDDQICDLGELCGAQPSAIEAVEIEVQEGETISSTDFAVGDLVFQSQETGNEKSRRPVIRLVR